jgi:tetratricopeptide (TPR) repeat protein
MRPVAWLRLLVGAVLTLGVFTVAGQAHADWYRAETDRFVVYGEGRESKVREYAAKLQTFDAVLRAFHPVTKTKDPATKVEVYLVDGIRGLRRIRPGLGNLVAGFYAASNEGVIAAAATEGTLQAEDVLFHEYGHHFMLENFPVAYPAWFVEGFAEYFMTAEITDAGVKVGGYNPSRAEAVFASWLPWEDVFAKTTGETRRQDMNAYYSQAWLLAHYMYSEPSRTAQLDKAIAAIAGGTPPLKAFEDATGLSPDELTKVLRRYRKLQLYLVKPPEPLPSVTVTRLSPGEAEFRLDHARLLLSATGKLDQDFLDGVRRRAQRYADDVFAQRTLARAEFVMGDVAAGEAIMTRLLAARPNDLENLLLAGTGQVLAGMREPKQRQARYRAARPMLAKAYALDKQDFRPLHAYALARSIEPEFPTDNDVTVLLEARALAPSVQENSVRAGLALLKKGRTADARIVLGPVMNNPHGGAFAAQARALLAGKSEAEAAAAGQRAEPASEPLPEPSPASAP